MATRRPISLVTGGNRGIGFAICRQLAEKGHYVIIGSRSVQAGDEALKLLRESGPGIEASMVPLDVTNQKTLSDAAAELNSKFGRLETLTNNAGAANEDDVTNLNLDEARQTFDVNFFGVVATTNAFLPLLRKASVEPARICNVTSIMASLAEHSDPNSAFIQETKVAAYSASKAALNMYTVHLARALRTENIAVNCVHPGYIQTKLANALPGKAPNDVEYGAKQIVDILMAGRRKGRGPTGGFFHNKLALRW